MNKTIWHSINTLDQLNQRGLGTMAQHLDIQFTEIGPDYLSATMPVDEKTRQPLGILNGGATCALAETVASTAANYCIDIKKYYCVGQSIHAHHLRPVSAGCVTAIAKPIHLGKKSQVWDIDVFSDQQKKICAVRMIMAVLARENSDVKG